MKKNLFKVLAAAVATVACVSSFAACGGAKKEQLIVYTEAGFAPFEYVSGGKIVGVDVDIMNLVGEKLNKEIVFENVSFDSIVDAVSAGVLTNVGAAGISVTPERQEKVDFSNEYYTANLYVIYQTSQAESYVSMTTDNVEGIYWESMTGKTIAVQSGTTADLFLGDEIAEGGTLFADGAATATKSDYDELATAVADIGLNADVLIIDELPAKKLIEGKDNLACAPLYYKGAEGENDEAAVDTYAICVTKGQTELLAAINEVLAELGKDGIQALVNKHLGIN